MANHKNLDWLQFSAAFSAGVLLLAFVPVLPPMWVLLAGAAIAVVLSCICSFSCRLSACVLAGLLWGCLFAGWQLKHLLPESEDNEEIVLIGTVKDFPRRDERGWQFDFLSSSRHGVWRLTYYDETGAEPAPRFDCRYTLRAKLRRPRGLLNEGLYDYGLWLLQAGYSGTGTVKAILGCEPYQPDLITQWRSRLAGLIDRVSMSEEARGTLYGLLIGSYAKVDAAQWQLWRDSGTIHLLSVSGLHIALVAWLVHILVTRLAAAMLFPLRFAPASCWGAVSALLCSGLYALLAGFSVATQRSLWMVAVALLQLLLRGCFQFGTAFWLSCFLVLLLNPLAIFSVGFWFSFWATAVLLLASYGRQRTKGFWGLVILRDACKLQLVLFVTVAPLLCYAYGKVTLVSIPMNLVAVPWASFVSLPLGLLACVADAFSPALADWLLRWSGWSLDIYWQAMRWAAQWGDPAGFSVGASSQLAVAMAAFGSLLLALAPRGLPLRAFGLLLCLSFLFPVGRQVPQGGAEMTVLDVGQGLSVIVQTARHALVYDTGDRRSARFDVGRDIVAPALRQRAIKGLDMLWVSHADSDHSGGAAGLMAMLSAGPVWSGTPDQLHLASPVLPCRAGMHWRWDGVDFTVVHPGNEVPEKDNNRSCVLKIEAGGHSALLTGDIEMQAEIKLLSAGAPIRSDVLVVPHHGSKTSSSAGFIRAVAPQLAIISAGYANRFHHPSSVVVNRYRDNGVNIANTAESGGISVRFTPDGAMSWQDALCGETAFWLYQRQTEACGRRH